MRLVLVVVVLFSIVGSFRASATSCQFPEVEHLGRGIHTDGILYAKRLIHTDPKQLEFPIVERSSWSDITVYRSDIALPMLGFFNQTRVIPATGAISCLVLVDHDHDENGTDVVVINGQTITPAGLIQNLSIPVIDGQVVIETSGINNHSHQGTVGVIVVPQEVPTNTPTATPTNTSTTVPTNTPTMTPTSTPTVAPTSTPTVVPTATPTSTPSVAPSQTPTATPTLSLTSTPTVTPAVVATSTPLSKPTLVATATSTPESDTVDYHPTDLGVSSEPFSLYLPAVSK